MKCKMIMTVALALAAVQAKADLAPTVMLRHNGASTFFKYYEVQQAVDAAVDGDTIYLTDGTYQPFNIDKRILVRGTGSGTIIEGDCEIDISGTAKLTMPVLDALTFNGSVIVNSGYSQFTIRQCYMTNLTFDGENHYDVKIDRCYIDNRLNLTNNVHEFNAFNSRIHTLYPHDYIGGQTTFEHCNIVSICDTIQGGVFNSCAIGRTSKFTGAKSLINLIGCVLNSCRYFGFSESSSSLYVCGSNCTRINCGTGDSSSDSYWMDFNSTKYISALDGTKVGAYGGQHPYSRTPELPRVTKHELNIDAATKTMKVKLTVSKP